MAIHESRAELGKQCEKRVVAGSPRADCRNLGLDQRQLAVNATTVRDDMLTDTSSSCTHELGPRQRSSGDYRCALLLVEIENDPPAPGYGHFIFLFGRRETASVVQSGLSRRERITHEGCAAEEKKHDKARSKETHGNWA